MESFARRGDVLLGYNPHTQFQNSPKSTNEDSDLDFSDVFGGPPRRFSMQEMRMRYSFGEPTESEQNAVLPGSSWSVFDEKPVFGAENVNRRSCQNADFFDDIFRGHSKSYSSPRISRDVFGSSPGSRILSPARPLPPRAEPFSTSVLSQFSLPAKLTKATDFAVFGSANRTLSSNVSLSRFSSPTTELQETTRKDQSSYCQSPLSHEVSPSINEKDREKLRNNSENVNVSTDNFQFHFSIYKWAGKGMPLLMPLLRSNKSRSKYKSKMERCASSSGRIHCESTYRDSPEAEEEIIAVNTEAVSSKVKDEKQDARSKERKTKSENLVKETYPEISESNPKAAGHPIPNGDVFSDRKTEESHSKHEGICEKSEEGIYIKNEQAQKPEQKPLTELFNDERQGQGTTADGEENKVKFSTAANEHTKISNSVKKTSSKGSNFNKGEGANATLQGSATKPGEAFDKSAVKGKVREFVKIFNQETSAKPQTNSEIPSQSSRWKGNENSSATKREEKVRALSTKKMPDASCREDDNLKPDKVKQDAHSRNSSHRTRRQSTNEKNAQIFPDLRPNSCEAKVENGDESFEGHFLVEELPHVLDKNLQTGGDSEGIKGLDAKIQQWSNGRKGNIRSLLSTLQLVLWPESGWKPVPLVDIIEGSAVKRAYQKALLCLHPDKLQQKGAASDHKYMAEKVFDILQEAWDHFLSLGAI